LEKSKVIYKAWVENGKPKVDHQTVEDRRNIKRLIRSQQRRDLADERLQFYSQILDSEKSVSLYKLIRRGLSNTVAKPQGFYIHGNSVKDLQVFMRI